MRFFIFLLLLIPALANATDILLTWDLPTQREDGSAIESIDNFNLYPIVNNAPQEVIVIPGDAVSYQIPDVAVGSHTFQISTVELGKEGALSDPVSVNVTEKIIAKAGKMILTIQVIE